MFKGKFFNDLENPHDLKAIATLIREAIADFKDKGLIDKRFKTTVRVSTNAIVIRVNDFPKDVELYKEDYKKGLIDSLFIDAKFTSEWLEVEKMLGDITNFWRYDNSNAQADYFETNYYGRVEVNPELKLKFDKQAHKVYNKYNNIPA